MERVKIQLAKCGALLLLLGMLTGGYAAAAMTGKIGVDAHTALVAHVAALLGAFMLFGLAYCLPMLRYTMVGATRLALCFIVATYANWFLTALKAAWHVTGIEFLGGDNVSNDFIFVLLSLLVVLPSLAGSFFWFAGFKKEKQEAPAP